MTANATQEICKNCGNTFMRRIKKTKGRRHKSIKVRSCNTVTCTTKCSRQYSRKGYKNRK